MAVFKFKAKDKRGKIKKGTIIAVSKIEAGHQLKGQGLSPLFVKKIKSVEKKFTFFSSHRLPLIEKANFCRYLATMIKSGLPLSEAIDVLYQEASHPLLKKILADIRDSIQKGQFLSTAFSQYPEVFDEIFLTLVKAGEETGSLDKSFKYLGKQLYADYELGQKIKSTLAYPIVVTLATFLLGISMLIFVVPKISPVLLRLSADFPLPTHTIIILKIGVFLSDNLLFVLAGLAGAIFFLISFLASRKGRKLLTNFLSRLPLIGNFYENLALARFNRTLSTLVRSGVPIIGSLQVASGALNLPQYQKIKSLFSEQISKGKPLSEILKKSKLFPAIMTTMVTTGEKTASLDKLLADLAVFYEEKVANSLKTMTNLVEPVLMLVIGLAVGLAVVSLIAPIYSFVGSLSQNIGGV